MLLTMATASVVVGAGTARLSVASTAAGEAGVVISADLVKVDVVVGTGTVVSVTSIIPSFF